MHQDAVDIFRRLFSWPDAWNETSSLLDIVGDPLRREDDERIEERECDDQCEIQYDSRDSRLLGIDIKIRLYPVRHRNQFMIHRLELGDEFGDEIWERYECDREDDRHHSYRIHRDRQRG